MAGSFETKWIELATKIDAMKMDAIEEPLRHITTTSGGGDSYMIGGRSYGGGGGSYMTGGLPYGGVSFTTRDNTILIVDLAKNTIEIDGIVFNIDLLKKVAKDVADEEVPF